MSKILHPFVVFLFATVFVTATVVAADVAKLPEAPEQGKPEQNKLQTPETPPIATPQVPVDEKVVPQPEKAAASSAKQPSWIGVLVAPIPDVLLTHFGVKEGEAGLIVVEQIVEDGPAAKAGLKRGDVVLRFADKDIHTPQDFVRLVTESPASPQPMVVLRGNRKTDLSITPIARPEKYIVAPAGRPRFDFGPERFDDPEHMFVPHEHHRRMRAMENGLRQMQGGTDSGVFIEEESAAETENLKGGETKHIELFSKTDKDGKTKIHVTRSLRKDGKVEKKSWDADSVKELPADIRDDVKTLVGE